MQPTLNSHCCLTICSVDIPLSSGELNVVHLERPRSNAKKRSPNMVASLTPWCSARLSRGLKIHKETSVTVRLGYCLMIINSYVFPCLKETTSTLGMSSSILLNISTSLLEMLFGLVSGPSEKWPLHKTTAGYSEGLVPSSRLETWPMFCSRSFEKACQNMRGGLNIRFKLILNYHGIFTTLASINQLYGLQIFVFFS